MSWFDLNKIWLKVIDENGLERLEAILDECKISEGQKFLEYCKDNKGLNIVVYDDLTLENLSESEIRKLDKLKNDEYVPIPELRISKSVVRVKTRARKPINNRLRLEIYERYNSKCTYCKDSKALQIHHKDKNPLNNSVDNLELVCFECHLQIEGKTRFKIV